MELIHVLKQLFETHAPETLMAFFGAMTSLLLFSLVWLVLRHFFGLQTSRADQEANQGLVTTALVESLVSALVTEGQHLRETLDNLLQKNLRYEQKNAQELALLLARSQETPAEVVELLRPEFDHLHQEIQQTEERIIAKIAELSDFPEHEKRKDPA